MVPYGSISFSFQNFWMLLLRKIWALLCRESYSWTQWHLSSWPTSSAAPFGVIGYCCCGLLLARKGGCSRSDLAVFALQYRDVVNHLTGVIKTTCLEQLGAQDISKSSDQLDCSQLRCPARENRHFKVPDCTERKESGPTSGCLNRRRFLQETKSVHAPRAPPSSDLRLGLPVGNGPAPLPMAHPSPMKAKTIITLTSAPQKSEFYKANSSVLGDVELDGQVLAGFC